MIHSLLLGVLAAIFALAGTWLSDNVNLFAKDGSENAAKPAYQVKKAGTLNVPILRQGELKGYLVVRLAYATDGSIASVDANTLEALVQDEVFRTLYSDTSINPQKLELFDLNGLAKQLAERIRGRISSDSFKDILISEFSYVPVSSLK
ncbi:MAG: hypothetical protein Q8M31_14215 [Beijerinckiaceae bacterium]|nr:hypothetical protein [Beijerinckiaceae bacterium]